MFAALEVYYDVAPRSAALNMAIDEALLETAPSPLIRFYRWNRPALSFGYFGKFSDVEVFAPERDLVRRWTGGGIVFHGDDLTYSIVIPTSDSAFRESSMSIYENVHRAVSAVLIEAGQGAELASVAAPGVQRQQIYSAIADRRSGKEVCFANPVRADVMLNGRKIAGAAQRRTRAGLLQQGSIQNVDLANDFGQKFAQELSVKIREGQIDNRIVRRAEQIVAERYGTESWLRRR